MQYVTTEYIRRCPPVFFNLPEAELKPGSWVVLATFHLPSNYVATYANATLDLLEVGEAPHTVVDANGLASLGIYSNFDYGIHPRAQTPVEEAIYAGNSNSSTRSSAIRIPPNPDYPSSGTYANGTSNFFVVNAINLTAGTYSVVVANNTSDHTYTVCAAGSLTISI